MVAFASHLPIKPASEEMLIGEGEIFLQSSTLARKERPFPLPASPASGEECGRLLLGLVGLELSWVILGSRQVICGLGWEIRCAYAPGC
jgi:hypothetical protein